MTELPDPEEQFAAFLAKAKADMERRTLLNWWIRRQGRLQESYVNADIPAIRSLHRWYLFKVALTATLVTLIASTLASWWWTALLIVPMCVLMVCGATAGRGIAESYRWGWLRGREQVRQSYFEAQARGMSEEEWIAATVEREMMVVW